MTAPKPEIQAYVDDSNLQLIDACDNAKDAWELLKHAYEQKSKARKLQLRRSLYELSIAPKERVSAYVMRAKGIMDQLKAAGYTAITEDEVCYALLSGLPKESTQFKTIKTILETSGEELTLEKVKVKLLQAEADQDDEEHEDQHMAFLAARTHGNDKRGEQRCWTCGKTGHIKRDCPTRRVHGLVSHVL